MDKVQLLMLLAQQAPRLLNALSKNSGWTNNFELNGIGIVNDLANRQYDTSIMEDTLNSRNGNIDSLVRTLAKDSIGPTDIFYNPEFPSDGSPAIDPNSSYEDLRDMYLGAVNNEGPDMPATASAAQMLLQNPDIGLEDPKKKLFSRLAKGY